MPKKKLQMLQQKQLQEHSPKCWMLLSLNFPKRAVRRMLRSHDYRERWLSPREAEAAVMFCDISGFTRVSEQLLRKPTRIGEMIDTWSAEVVRMIWASGGVFDKMGGDCVIGLWGPPFFEMSAQEACRASASVARRIQDYTRSLNDSEDFPELHGAEPIGVAIGLNYCQLCIGHFGPNDDYTGFSSGMNNTARLQGLAEREEILCMDTFVDHYDAANAFGPEDRAQVKNVAAPIRFRPYRGVDASLTPASG